MRRLTRSMVISGMAVGAVIGSASIVSAAPSEDYVGNPKASCVGIISSEHAQTDGGADDNVRLGKSFAPLFGLSYGELVRLGAHAHLGTHAACGG